MISSAKAVAAKGRYGDTKLLHVSPDELGLLSRVGKVTRNPKTGLPEAFNLGNILGGLFGGPLGPAVGRLGNMFRSPDVPQNAAFTPNQAVTDALYKRQTQYLDPQWEQLKEQNRAELANQGFQVGNVAYDRATNNFDLARQRAYADARDSAIAQGANLGLQQQGLQNQFNLGTYNVQAGQRNANVQGIASLISGGLMALAA
jgi:hypothetical protein